MAEADLGYPAASAEAEVEYPVAKAEAAMVKVDVEYPTAMVEAEAKYREGAILSGPVIYTKLITHNLPTIHFNAPKRI